MAMKSFDTLVGPAMHATMKEDRQLKKVISQIVPGATMAHILFCRIDSGSLRVTVDSSIWIPRLRFSNSQIIDYFRQQSYPIELVSYHVAPENSQQPRTVDRKPLLPRTGTASPLKSLVSELASHSDAEDDRLLQALSRLAKNLES